MSFDTLASKNTISLTIKALNTNGIQTITVDTAEDALAQIKKLIPPGASVMNGSSKSLEQIGFIDYLKSGSHGWNNLHQAVLAEKDPIKQAALRKQSVLSDYYLGSVHALTQEGELVIASNSGSQLPHIVFTSPNIIFVIGTQKIVPNLEQALKRLEEYVVPLEDVNIQKKYGIHTMLAKILILKRENPMMGRKVTIILVNQTLGF
jgi:L-lactate utilization protein LutC